MTALAATAAGTRLRLFTVRDMITDALKVKASMTDPDATRLCAVLSHVSSAIEILQEREMPDLKKLPPASLGQHRRWAITVISDTVAMESGYWDGDQYRYGLAATGKSVEEVPTAFWGAETRQAFILETAEPDRFRFSRHNVLTEAEMIVGPEIFTVFGFEQPGDGPKQTEGASASSGEIEA